MLPGMFKPIHGRASGNERTLGNPRVTVCAAHTFGRRGSLDAICALGRIPVTPDRAVNTGPLNTVLRICRKTKMYMNVYTKALLQRNLTLWCHTFSQHLGKGHFNSEARDLAGCCSGGNLGDVYGLRDTGQLPS